MSRLPAVARIAKIAMWIMIIVLILSFFTKSKWITITWIVAAAVCLLCTLLVAFNKNR
jgi:hypothetical protein